ncbi:MAG: sensor histidine kinase N-terminal domain-containing protein, partial [Stenotrophomonas maltophilia]|nr:sensor histidine kinase N-terminal domain-containing protein [Stenotrophomonas maltophilia]
SYDHLLVSSALSIADSVALVDGQWQVDLPYAALDLLAMAPEDRVFYRVADSRGNLITGYGDLPAPPRRPGTQPQLFDAAYSGETVRFVVVGRSFAAASAQGEVQVQVGQTRRAREAVAQDMVNRALLAIGVLSGLLLALVAFGVHRAFRPLVRVERELSRREPSDLKPLDARVPREMDQMVAALNRFMERLSSSNETLRAFMAEAAHQMRTPLAALRAQAQLALDDDDPEDMRRSLQAIERNATHMSRLLNQLLSDASVIHRSHLQRFAAVDLAETVHQALHEALPQAGPAPRVQLAMTAEPVQVHGDALLLREAIKNLVDNALKYGGDGPLHIALTVEGGQA